METKFVGRVNEYKIVPGKCDERLLHHDTDLADILARYESKVTALKRKFGFGSQEDASMRKNVRTLSGGHDKPKQKDYIDLTAKNLSEKKLEFMTDDIIAFVSGQTNRLITFKQLQEMKEKVGFHHKASRRVVMNKIQADTKFGKFKWSYEAIRDGIMNECDDIETLSALSDEINTRPVNQKSLKTLAPKKWLNDDVINNYFAIIVAGVNATSNTKGGMKSIGALNSGFMVNLYWKNQKYLYDNVDRLKMSHVAGKGQLFNLSVVYVPINVKDIHWILAEIHMELKVVSIYDSLGERNDEHIGLIFKFMQDEYKMTYDSEMNLDEWSIVSYGMEEIPKQANGYDCGVFVCMFLFLLANRYAIVLNQDDADLFRMHIAVSIVCSCRIVNGN